MRCERLLNPLAGMVLAVSLFGIAPAIAQNVSAVEKKEPVVVQTLQRADLRIAGTSCAACLMRIEGKLNKIPGVSKAAVSVFSPYAAIIIYDSSATDLAKIRAQLTDEPVTFERIKEKKVDKVPQVLLPPAVNSEGMAVH